MAGLDVLIEDQVRNKHVPVTLDQDRPVDTEINWLINYFDLPRRDFNLRPITYQLVRAPDKLPLQGSVTLSEAGITKGELLQLHSPQGSRIWQEIHKTWKEIELRLIDTNTTKLKGEITDEERNYIDRSLSEIEKTQARSESVQETRKWVSRVGRVKKSMKQVDAPAGAVSDAVLRSPTSAKGGLRELIRISLIVVGLVVFTILLVGSTLLGALILIWLIGSGPDEGTVQPPLPVEPGEGTVQLPLPVLKVKNETNFEICFIFIWRPDEEPLGKNWLDESGPIEKRGETRTFSLPKDTYHLRAETCGDRTSIDPRFAVELDGNYPWNISDQDLDKDGITNDYERELGTKPDNPDSDGDKYRDRKEIFWGTDPHDPKEPGPAPLIIKNDMMPDICFIYIWRSDSPQKGDNQLNDVPPFNKILFSESDEFRVIPGHLYNLQANACDGSTLDERTGKYIDEAGFFWTITD